MFNLPLIALRLASSGVSESSSSAELSPHKMFATVSAVLLLFAFLAGKVLTAVIVCSLFCNQSPVMAACCCCCCMAKISSRMSP